MAEVIPFPTSTPSPSQNAQRDQRRERAAAAGRAGRRIVAGEPADCGVELRVMAISRLPNASAQGAAALLSSLLAAPTKGAPPLALIVAALRRLAADEAPQVDVDLVEPLLSHGDRDVRHAAAMALRAGPEAAKRLRSLILDHDAPIRAIAIAAQADASLLIEALIDPAGAVRRAAFFTALDRWPETAKEHIRHLAANGFLGTILEACRERPGVVADVHQALRRKDLTRDELIRLFDAATGAITDQRGATLRK